MIKNLHNLMLMVCCFELLDAFAFSFPLVYPLLKEVVSLAVKELIYSHYGCTDIFHSEAFLKKKQLFESSCGIDELEHMEPGDLENASLLFGDGPGCIGFSRPGV